MNTRAVVGPSRRCSLQERTKHARGAFQDVSLYYVLLLTVVSSLTAQPRAKLLGRKFGDSAKEIHSSQQGNSSAIESPAGKQIIHIPCS